METADTATYHTGEQAVDLCCPTGIQNPVHVMPTIDLSQNYQIMDNPETAVLVNPGGSQVSTNYAFRRQGTLAYMDQNGVAKLETITRWLIFKTNVHPWVPEINCKITSGGEEFYVNSIDAVAMDSYYVLQSSKVM